MDECPVCLEPLTGTVVHLGCCKKQVHIQCYIPRCPLCRADLPLPPNHPPQHVIVPIPVSYAPLQPQMSNNKKAVVSCLFFLAFLTPIIVVYSPKLY